MESKMVLHLAVAACALILVRAEGGQTTPPPKSPCVSSSLDGIPKTPHLPSQEMTVSCTCVSNNSTVCPNITVDKELEHRIDVQRKTEIHFGNQTSNCTTSWKLHALGDPFRRRRFDLKLTCSANDTELQTGVVSFEQSDNGENCTLSSDCWTKDQECLDGMCTCHPDTPVYVWEVNSCFPAVSWGGDCLFDAQCQSKDNNTMCTDKRCACRAGYSTTSPTDLTCRTGQCLNWTMSVMTKKSYFPSEEVTASCTCYSNQTVACPNITSLDLLPLARLVIHDARSDMSGNNCTRFIKFHAEGELFERRSLDLKLVCQHGVKELQSALVHFQQSSNGENCSLATDCWSTDQECLDGKCQCYSEAPNYVLSEDKCYPSKSYGQECQFNEECQGKDGNAICKEKICTCKDKYHTTSSTDVTCTTSDSSLMIPSKAAILGTLFLSTLLLFRKV